MRPEIPARYTSIIVTSFTPDRFRAGACRSSIDSLIASVKGQPVEIIVVDNGGAIDMSDYFMSEVRNKTINFYIKNAENMHFGYARNQGLAMAHGNYICIADNDIFYQNKEWINLCWEVLERHPDKKIYSTPLEYPTGMIKEIHDRGTLPSGKYTFNLNDRAGSNCFVMRRKDFYEVGEFAINRIAGTKWTDKACRLGYVAAVTPQELRLVCDIGLRMGYNHKVPLPVKVVLASGDEVYFNEDEYFMRQEQNG
jgi:glycosyltransferase involved in cell wall biosynthesis